MANITMKDMLDAGVHFGHQTQRWNPKMKPYVYTDRGGIHIIDLQKSVVCAKNAAEAVKKVAANGGRMIFVGTKKQAIEPIKEAATKCGQYYVTKRWLGGMLTNFQTIKTSIDRLKKIDQMREKKEIEFFGKKERAKIDKEYLKLVEYLEGIRDMKDSPACMFVVDLNKEHIAVAEAKRLGCVVVGIADTNVDPNLIDFPIPGNDDAIRSIKLFSNLMAEAYIEGSKEWQEKVRTGQAKEEDAKPQVQEERQARGEKRNERGGGRPQRGGAASKPKDASAAPNAAAAAGPDVVKVSRGRKMVAAGMAEDVEIAMELDSNEQATETETTEEKE